MRNYFNPQYSAATRGGLSGFMVQTAAVVPPPLDVLAGAVAAFSVSRKLRTDYAGSAFRVRRSTDNAELDIGYVGNEVDTAALLAHCGAGSGFITTLYDNSVNAFNATNATAANQPRIVNAGVLDVQGSKPYMVFDGTNDTLALSGSGLAIAKNVAGFTGTVVLLMPSNGVSKHAYSISTGTSATSVRQGFQKTAGNGYQGTAKALDADGGAFSSAFADDGSVNIVTCRLDYSAPLLSMFKAGTLLGSTSGGMTAGNTSNTDSLSVSIGSRSTSVYMTGSMAECIFYASALSTGDRLSLERNQGSYYGITVA